MTCREVRERFGEALDAEVWGHVQECPMCREEFQLLQYLETVLTPARKVTASPGFKDRVMRAAMTKEESRAWFPTWAWVAAAAAVLLIAIPFASRRNGATALLAESAGTWSDVRSVHLSGRMRALPRQPFDSIDLNAEFVPIELWKDFSQPQRWRVQKPGRVAAMNGRESTLFIEPSTAMRAGVENGFVEWLRPLLDADTVLEREYEAIRANTVVALMETDSKLLLSHHDKGGYRNSWTKNKTIAESDHTCLYRFDPATKRLVGLEVAVQSDGRDIVVLAIDSIRYNEALDPALFSMQLPEHVNWMLEPKDMSKGSRPLPDSPKATAARLFEAYANQDWSTALTVLPESQVSDGVKKGYGGLTVLSLGEPFQSGLYRGWFVPYEIRLPSGRVKKHNLAVRNDNPEHRWVVDGGI